MSQQYTFPDRASVNAPDSPTTFRIPYDRQGILDALEVAQFGYESSKDIAVEIAEARVDLDEHIAEAKAEIVAEVNQTAWPSAAEKKRREDYAIEQSSIMQEYEKELIESRRAAAQAEKTVSIFRERMLTLRSALDSLAREGGR